MGVTAIKPPERHGFDVIKYFIHDPDKGEWFTRTPKSWFLIILFYCIYYTCLAGFWYGMLQVFFMFVPLDQPRYMLGESLIGTNPGLGMQPGQPDVTIDSSMLWLRAYDSNSKPSEDFETDSNADWAARYQRFLKKYENKTETRDCPNDQLSKEDRDACSFDINALGPCSQFPYGFVSPDGRSQVEPCILLKINRIFNWEPQPFEVAELDDIEGMSENVKQKIRANPNQIYVDCQGENPADVEALNGQIKYYPEDQGISFKFFPYNHAHRNYHNPIVAVKFGSGIPVGQLVHIECKLWTKGVEHNRKDRIGQVHLEVFLNEK